MGITGVIMRLVGVISTPTKSPDPPSRNARDIRGLLGEYWGPY